MPATKPMPVRFEKALIATLEEGMRRTPHKKQELIRITLRRYLPRVIEEESVKKTTGRITNVEPWPKSVLKELYKKRDREWEKVEDAATKAQGTPSFDD